jgi:hypothetical protein
MIRDQERLIDGFRGVPAGMDGSKDPPFTPEDAVWFATNVTFRGGGGPRTRPGFREIPVGFWRNPQPRRSASIALNGTLATVTCTGHGYDAKDIVTISGASVSGLNDTWTITKVNDNTFTFPTALTGTVTGTITAFRDIDSTYAEDYFSGRTSRGRFTDFILGATYVQGADIYEDPRSGNPSQMIVIADGRILALDFNSASCRLLNETDLISDDVPAYTVQAEKYLVIQTGQDEPRVFDGYSLRRASFYGNPSVPIGKQMAFGQGRLFVAVNEGLEIVAGDLIFGGSSSSVGITSSSAANPTVITTSAPHGLTSGDQVTLQGHSASPFINSTYTATVTGATAFTIPVSVTSAGSGGTVSKFNAGRGSDCLRFSETTFLNEGGSFSPAGNLGAIKALEFLPVQDTATGQGDLIAFCERGAVTFQVSAARDQWKSTAGFQRILFGNIGSASESVIPVNGDLFFRSKEGNGIRNYRNARAEADSYGQTPVSAEIDPILKQDTDWLLDPVSFAYFDNRLLMTCWPRQYPRVAVTEDEAEQFAAEPVPVLFSGIAVLDFNSVSSGRGKSAAVFDGVWTGLRVLKLLAGAFDREQRCYALCLHEDETGRRVELWQVTRDDEFDTPIEGRRQINAGITTRGMTFGNDERMSLKKLIRCDLWFSDLNGGEEFPFNCSLAYRPDDYPNFTTWGTAERKFRSAFSPADGQNYERGYAPQIRFPTPPLDPNVATLTPAYLGYDFVLRVEWTGRARLGRLMLHSLKSVESVGGGTL